VQSVASDFIILQQLGWGLVDKESDGGDGMGCGKFLTNVEKNDLAPTSDENGNSCNDFYFAFECQGWSDDVVEAGGE